LEIDVYLMQIAINVNSIISLHSVHPNLTAYLKIYYKSVVVQW